MAFVFRAERKFQTEKQTTNIGPGSYEAEKHEQTSIPKAYVPFNSMEPRVKLTKQKESTPGPGAYNITRKNDQEKIVVENATEDIKILEITKPNAMFKSGTKRFAEVINTGPGPADYQKQYKSKSVRKPQQVQSQKPRIIQHLIKINKYQSIPSIPSNIHAYGYYQNQQTQLQLNEPPTQVTTGKRNDMVGPGQYNISQPLKSKGYSWKVDKTSKLPAFQGNNNVGPGSYDIRDGVPLYNYKPSVAFISNTLRSGDPKKPLAAQNKFSYTDRAKLTNQSQAMSQKAPESTHMDSSDDEYEYLEDATPGPGSYINLDSVTTKHRNPAKSLHFGSTSKRFNDLPAIKNNIIGPGEYNISIEKRSFSYQKKKVAPFDSKIQRFTRHEPTKGIPGPGSYEPRNALQDELIFKIQRGYRGQFGTTEQRFKQPGQVLDVGPGSYDIPASGVVQTQIQSYGTSSFKNKVTKESTFKNQNPPPGSYNIDYYDISKKAIKEEDEDPDLIIKKPGFNVGADRFKKQIIKQDMFQDEDLLNQIHTKVQEEQKRNKTNMVPFNSNQPRLVQKKRDIPGPGEYDINNDQWNKRTYNILFADI